MTKAAPQALAKRCSECGAGFDCGINLEQCWCSQLPLLESSQIDAAADCLCLSCLERKLDTVKSPLSPKIKQ